MKFLIHVDAVADVQGALSVEAASEEEALEKAKLRAEQDAYWSRPKNVRVVVVAQHGALEPSKG